MTRSLLDRIVGVPAPTEPVFRVSRLGSDPFGPIPWGHVGTSRYDDPKHAFRMIYCASARVGAFGETIARYRRSMRILAWMHEIEDDTESLGDALAGLLDPDDPRRGIVPADWRFKRQVSSAVLNHSLRFVDIAAPENVSILRELLAPTAIDLGLDDIDLSSVFSTDRGITQECARIIYDVIGEDGRPRFAGIRYLSRFNLNWVCWAVFDDRLRHASERQEATIDPHDEDLLAAARLLHLGIEGVRGQIILP